jgi:hypothetical protein
MASDLAKAAAELRKKIRQDDKLISRIKGGYTSYDRRRKTQVVSGSRKKRKKAESNVANTGEQIRNLVGPERSPESEA